MKHVVDLPVVHSEAPACVVVIPAKNEADRLPACLAALAAQRDTSGRRFFPTSLGVLVFANDCEDDSAAIARRLLEGFPFCWRVAEASLPRPRAHAGGARREAMNMADAWLRENGEAVAAVAIGPPHVVVFLARRLHEIAQERLLIFGEFRHALH